MPALGLVVQGYVQRTRQPHVQGQTLLQPQRETVIVMTMTVSANGTVNVTAMVIATATGTSIEAVRTTATACTAATVKTSARGSASGSASAIEAATATSVTLMPFATQNPVCNAWSTAVIVNGTGTGTTILCRSATPETTPLTGTNATVSATSAEAPTSKTRTGTLP